MAAICEGCKKEGAERPQPYPNSIENGHHVMVSLEIAATDGHPKCLGAIINTGADVNYVNNCNGYTPLVWAARYGHPECVDMLIKAGADVNKALSGHPSVLMYASEYNGNASCVKLLLEAGADVNYKSRDGKTALMRAACYGHIEVVQHLINVGADVNASNNDGYTALRYSIVSPSGWKCVDMLIEAGADVNETRNGLTALMWAVENGYEKCAEMLIKAGADVNMVDVEHGKTVLHFAAGKDDKCFEMLLEAGADVNIKGHNGYTVLMTCTDHRNYDRAKKVIEAGADVNVEVPEPEDRTVLFLAAYHNNCQTIRLLLRNGIKINKLNGKGNNALEKYLSHHNIPDEEICMLLFAAGESVTKVTDTD